VFGGGESACRKACIDDFTFHDLQHTFINNKRLEGHDYGRFDVESYLTRYGVNLVQVKPHGGGVLFCLQECLFDPSHNGNEAAIGQTGEGKLYYQCFHNSCKGRTWAEARAKISGPKLPAPREDDLSKGILETIDMDSYRVEVQEAMRIALPDQDAEIGPVPTSGGGRKPEPEIDRLSTIIKAFNDQFGNIDWKDADRIRQVIAEEIPTKVAADKAYQNAMRNSDKAAARLEHDRALRDVVVGMLKDHTELFKQFAENPSFKKWLSDTIFGATYEGAGV
jgi:hypothetical protein